jgi:nucleoporin NUP159
MNVTQLQQPPPQSGPARFASEAEDITPDLSGLPMAWNCYTYSPIAVLDDKFVNKRTRSKLSPEPLNLAPIPNKAQLFVVVSTLGWFAASTGLGTFSLRVLTVLNASIQALVATPLADVRSHLSSLDPNSDISFQPQRKIPLSSVTPNHLLFALNDSKLDIGLTHGPIIIFDAGDICSPGGTEVTPHTFLPTTPTPTVVRQMYANPGGVPELVAILREPDGSPNSQLVEVINVSTLQSVAGWSAGGTPETSPSSSSYSLLSHLDSR